MGPEDYLEILTGISNYTEMLTKIRDMLIDQGWSQENAEIASITYMGAVLNATKRDSE